MINKIKNYIERERLKDGNRTREFNYKRIVIAKILREEVEEVITLQECAHMLGRVNHATILNMVNNYHQLIQYKDFQKVDKQVRVELDIKTLAERVLEIDNMADLHWLQEELKADRTVTK